MKSAINNYWRARCAGVEPVITPELKEYWKQEYHRRKHDAKYIKARKLRSTRYWKRHVFVKMAKMIRRKDNQSIITASHLWRIAKSQKLLCALTGRRLTVKNISPDHIKHKCNGGTSSPENIRLVVREVNVARNSLSDAKFISLCDDVVKTSLRLTLK